MAEDVLTTDDPAAAAPTESTAAGTPRPTDWWAETKGMAWLLLAVLGFHSFVAKPFYIPSESMLPGLEVGDRLVVNKFAYGWSFVSPTIPDPVAILGSLTGHHEDSWGVQLPFTHGRLWGKLPERGDIAIVTPPGTNNDYIKRVIGLPGDRLEVRGGQLILNGVPVKRGPLHYVDLRDYGGVTMQEGGETCDPMQYDGPAAKTVGADGKRACRLPVVTETLPGGRTFDTVDIGDTPADDYGPIVVPAGRVFMMGDNRDHSADSRVPLGELGLGGPVPWEQLGGRAEFITFSLDGTASLNPLTWWASLRSGRAGTSLHPAETRPEPAR